MGFLAGKLLLHRFLTGLASMAVLVLMAVSCAPQSGPDALGLGEVRGPYLLIKTVSGDFEQVVEDVKGAVARLNFPVGAVRDYRKSFSRRLKQIGGGRLPFKQYRIIEFCNVQLAIRALSTDLRMGIFLPCRIVVFSPPGGEKVILMTINPSFMAEALDNPRLAPIAREVEAVIREIFQAVE